MNKYRLRPAYGKKELLIEFVTGPEKDLFLADLEKTLTSIEPKIIGKGDLWVNDELLFELNTLHGKALLTLDTWDFAFIMAENNQELILKIDAILSKNENYLKEIVDFEKYQ